jgi:protein disulfide isomerase family A protein 3
MYKFLLALALSLSVASADINEKDVTVLTEANFESWIAENPLALVEFYAPWCGHCKNLAPAYAAAATKLAAEDPPIALGKVDATEESALAGRFSIQGYPTLKVFRGDVSAMSDYAGPRDEAGIVKYMRAQSGPSAKPVARGDELTKFLSFDEDVSIVGYFTSADSEAAKSFLKAADALREDFRFGIVVDAESADTIVTHRPAAWKGEEPEITFKGDATDTEAIKRFAAYSSVPLAGEFNGDTAPRYAATRKPRLTVYTDVDAVHNPSGHKYYINRLRKAAKNPKFENAIAFALSDRSSGPGAQEYAELGMPEDATFAVAIFDATGAKFRLESADKFSVGLLEDFATAFLAGEVEQHIKSEEVPTEQGPVRTLVGRNFDEEVFGNDDDVFVEFYAPWCGHCKRLAPTWDELAEKANDEDLGFKVAKVDCTVEKATCGKFGIRGYPTLHFFKDGVQQGDRYGGARTIDALSTHAANLVGGDKGDL